MRNANICILFVAELKEINNSDIKTLPPLDIKWSAPYHYHIFGCHLKKTVSLHFSNLQEMNTKTMETNIFNILLILYIFYLK